MSQTPYRALHLAVIASGTSLLFLAAQPTALLRGQHSCASTIRQLIDDLESTEYPVRQNAYQRLADLDDALPILHRLSTFPSLESRRRIEQLIKLHIERRGVCRVEKLMKRKAMAELDLFVDTCIQNRSAVDKNAWRFIVERAAALWKKDRERIGVAPPPSLRTCLLQPISSAKHVADPSATNCHRVLCTSLALERRPLSGSFVICAGSCSADEIANSIVLANGPVVVGEGGPGSAIIHSLVFADGDVACEEIRQSVVIATGRIKCTIVRESALHGKVTSETAPAPLFDLRSVGLALRAEHGKVVVDSVRATSKFGTAGLRAADVVRKVNGVGAQYVSTTSRALRAGLANPMDLQLSIERGREVQRITIRNSGR